MLGVYPQLMFKIIDPAVHPARRTSRSRHSEVITFRARPGVRMERPTIDWHALAPELVLVVGINLVLLVDLWSTDLEEVDHGARSRASCCSARWSRSSRWP